MARIGTQDDDGRPAINPQRVFWELSSQLPDNVILCDDVGSHTNWYARDPKIRRGMMASLSGTLATMGSGVLYAIAAKMALVVAGTWLCSAQRARQGTRLRCR